MNEYLQEALALTPELKAIKEDIHRHPELSFHEVRTTKIIQDQLLAMGFHLVHIGMETGAVAVLEGGKPGPAVALRADIDAIAQQESPDHGGVVSEEPGVMHACGHDFHITCLLGAARILANHREELAGSVYVIFQPAEEVTQGAAAMVAHGLWDKLPEIPKCIFALHTRPEVPAGQVALVQGGIMSGKCHFTLKLTGVAGHGGAPHQCVDVITAGAAIVEAVQTIPSRCTDPREPLVCAVLSIHAGTEENFVPETLTMTGAIRAHAERVMEETKEHLRRLMGGIAESYRCRWTLDFIPQVPVTYNSPEMTALARKAAAAVVGEENLCTPRGDMASEDFSVLTQTAPGFFYWLGTGFPDRENPGWHHDCFRTDDDALPIGAALLTQSVFTALET